MTDERNMVIHFMDGSKVAYDFPKQVEDDLSIASRISKFLELQYVIVECEGVMRLYPVSNIKSIHVYPLSDIIPDFVIRGAKSVETY